MVDIKSLDLIGGQNVHIYVDLLGTSVAGVLVLAALKPCRNGLNELDDARHPWI